MKHLIKDGSAGDQKNVSDALQKLAANGKKKRSIANEGGIGPLIQLVKDGTAGGKERAAGEVCMGWREMNRRGRLQSVVPGRPLVGGVRSKIGEL